MPQKGEVLGMASWDRVKQIVGHLMEREEGYPFRYRVKGFPTAEERALIGIAWMD